MVRIAFVASAFGFLLHSSLAAQPQCTKPRNFTAQDRIVGGRVAVIENWPGQAALRLMASDAPVYVCGGSLIQTDVVLTAAHCVAGWSKGKNGWVDERGYQAEVVLGTHDLRTAGKGNVYEIASVTVHEAYTSAARGNDIALIQLRLPSSEERARLSFSAQSDPTPASVTPLMVAGFGVQAEGSDLTKFDAQDSSAFFAGASRLLETAVPLADAESCKKAYGNGIGAAQICAGFVEGGKDSCQGDSGGPLVAFDRYGCPYQVGLVSWGAGCARSNSYGIYTRISSFAPWIRKHVEHTRAVALEDLGVPTSPKSALVESTFAQLRDELSSGVSRASLSILSGTKLRVGDRAVFKLTPTMTGRAVIIDINATGEVAQIFPNQYSAGARIEAGQDLIIPGSSAYQFPVQEPFGRGKLVALVVPDHFNLQALEQAKQTRGFAVEAGLPYFQNLIQLIRLARGGAKGFGIEATGTTEAHRPPHAPDWGLAELDYEVVP